MALLSGLKILTESLLMKFRCHTGSCSKPKVSKAKPLSKALRTSKKSVPAIGVKDGRPGSNSSSSVEACLFAAGEEQENKKNRFKRKRKTLKHFENLNSIASLKYII